MSEAFQPPDGRLQLELASLLEDAYDYIVGDVEDFSLMNEQTISLLRRIEDALNMPEHARITG